MPFINVPICGECWINDALTKPERCLFDGDVPVGVLLPVRVVPPSAAEVCGFCGGRTLFGAYMRMRDDDVLLFANRTELSTSFVTDPFPSSVEEQIRYSDSERPSGPPGDMLENYLKKKP
mgnify:CR=1 FL=1